MRCRILVIPTLVLLTLFVRGGVFGSGGPFALQLGARVTF